MITTLKDSQIAKQFLANSIVQFCNLRDACKVTILQALLTATTL